MDSGKVTESLQSDIAGLNNAIGRFENIVFGFVSIDAVKTPADPEQNTPAPIVDRLRHEIQTATIRISDTTNILVKELSKIA